MAQPKATVISIPGPRCRVTLTESRGFATQDLDKVKKALCVLAYVINTDEFEDRVKFTSTPDMYSHHYWTEPRKFTSTNEVGPIVYERIMKSNELGTTGDDNELDFSLQYYNSWWSRVIGYTLPKQLWIWLNWKYHVKFKTSQMAGNLFHEWLHKLGYNHSSASDKTSVPYALGYLIEELAEKYAPESLEWLSKIEVTEVGA